MQTVPIEVPRKRRYTSTRTVGNRDCKEDFSRVFLNHNDTNGSATKLVAPVGDSKESKKTYADVVRAKPDTSKWEAVQRMKKVEPVKPLKKIVKGKQQQRRRQYNRNVMFNLQKNTTRRFRTH